MIELDIFTINVKYVLGYKNHAFGRISAKLFVTVPYMFKYNVYVMAFLCSSQTSNKFCLLIFHADNDVDNGYLPGKYVSSMNFFTVENVVYGFLKVRLGWETNEVVK